MASSSLCSVGNVARFILLVSVVFGVATFTVMHSAAVRTLSDDNSMDQMMESVSRIKEENSLSALASKVASQFSLMEQYEAGIAELASKVESMQSKSKEDKPEIENKTEEFQSLRQQLSELSSKIEKLEAASSQKSGDGEEDGNLRKQVKEDRMEAQRTRDMVYGLEDQTRQQFGQTSQNIADLADFINGVSSIRAADTNKASKRLKIHWWDDSTHEHPREDILENEGWIEYNGNFDASSEPWFEFTDDPYEADIIIWITVMARHEQEIPPVNPIRHSHKVIVLDYADGGTIQKRRPDLLTYRTELAYFKRSYIMHDENNAYGGNITERYDGAMAEDIFPYAYSGSRVMMIPLDGPEADPNFQVKLLKQAKVYGKVAKPMIAKENYDDGYYKDPRYENFLVRYKDRKWNVVNVLREWRGTNVDRGRIIDWTNEFSLQQAGAPRGGNEVEEELKTMSPEETASGFASYVGEIDSFCDGLCFGNNYFRHLRDAKIVVTCNPSRWEGDFRLYEAFLSGALVMVDKMYILEWMPNPPIHGKHWVTYDPGNKTDFMSKLAYYSDPANIDEAEAIAHAGYEWIMKHHMTVNRVDYILNHEKVKTMLMTLIRDPSKREILGYPPL